MADHASEGRIHAAESLFKVGEIEDGVALRAALEQTDDPVRRLMACAALARQGNARATELIRASLRSDEEARFRIAAWILGRVGDASDIAWLQEALTRSEPLTKAFVHHASCRPVHKRF